MSERTTRLRGAFYRQARVLHGYLSAFAFLALMFFSASGLLLNHPDWLAGRPAQRVLEAEVPPAELAAALAAAEPLHAVADLARRHVDLPGGLASGEIDGQEAFLRFAGVGGAADVTVDGAEGRVEVTVKPNGLVGILGELHRGKDAGIAWKLFIDISAGVFLALSLLGYVLFFTLRLRLANSLRLTGAGLAVMGALYWLFVP